MFDFFLYLMFISVLLRMFFFIFTVPVLYYPQFYLFQLNVTNILIVKPILS